VTPPAPHSMRGMQCEGQKTLRGALASSPPPWQRRAAFFRESQWSRLCSSPQSLPQHRHRAVMLA